MKYVYIPIEIAKREALPKSFLAASLAARGYKILLFNDYIFDAHGYPGPGIYIGKNCFKTEVPYSLKYYEKLKKQGIVLLYLDEEGGVYGGSSVADWKDRIFKRVDPKTFSNDDYYLSWGTWQAEAYKEHSNAKVVITGSPNFEICKKKYRDVLKLTDDAIKHELKKYILINTRFNVANPSKGFDEIFGEKSPSSKLLSIDNITTTYALDYIYLGYFIKMVKNISKEFKNIKIVVRPHPTENAELYKKIFRDYENIIVSNDGNVATWLRDALVVIHNGCSTAIQTKFADIPIISYTLENDSDLNDDAEPGLPNLLGHKANSIHQVINLIKSIIKGEINENKNDDIYASIDNINSFEAITDLVSTINLTALKRSEITLKRIGVEVSIRHLINKILFKKSTFDYDEFSRVPSYIAAASEYYKLKITASKLCDGLYKIESL